MKSPDLPRREALRRLSTLAAGVVLPLPITGCGDDGPIADGPSAAELPLPANGPHSVDDARFHGWVHVLQEEGFTSRSIPLGQAAARVGELAAGTPYEGSTLESYIRAGDSPIRSEPLTHSLTRFDCVSLVESCLAIARVARASDPPTWEAFAMEIRRAPRANGSTRMRTTSWCGRAAEARREMRRHLRAVTRDAPGVASQDAQPKPPDVPNLSQTYPTPRQNEKAPAAQTQLGLPLI